MAEYLIGYSIGFLTCLLMLYIIRREVEQVANGERVATKKETNKSEG